MGEFKSKNINKKIENMNKTFKCEDTIINITFSEGWKERLESFLDNSDLFLRIAYWEGGSITLEDDTVYIYGDNGILEFEQITIITI